MLQLFFHKQDNVLDANRSQVCPNTYYYLTNIYKDIDNSLPQFQTQKNLACASYHDLYYFDDANLYQFCTLSKIQHSIDNFQQMNSTCLCASASKVFAGGLEGHVGVFDLSSNQVKARSLVSPTGSQINHVEFDTSSNQILCSSDDKTIRLLDLACAA